MGGVWGSNDRRGGGGDLWGEGLWLGGRRMGMLVGGRESSAGGGVGVWAGGRSRVGGERGGWVRGVQGEDMG